jgi:hypothetical protein
MADRVSPQERYRDATVFALVMIGRRSAARRTPDVDIATGAHG